MEQLTIGFAICGSFCTFSRVLPQLELLCRGYRVVPILSQVSFETDSRFGPRQGFLSRIEAACGRPIVHTLPEAEPIGPRRLLDALIVAPCTGTTLAKLAAGIADTPVTLACKAQLRNERPVILAVSSNDALAGNAKNLGELLARRHFYFVPFGQDDPLGKPCSLVAHMELIPETLRQALEGRQIQPMLREYPAR